MSAIRRATTVLAIPALALLAACGPDAAAPAPPAASPSRATASSGAPSAVQPAPTGKPPTVPASDRGPGCRTDDGDQARPTTTPPGTVFQPLGSLLVPVSASTGPLIREGGVWRCYAHTPEGAARAASVLAAIDTGHPDWEQAARTQITPPELAKEYADHRLADPLHAEATGSVKIAGFSVMTYTPDQAMVMLLAALPGAPADTYGTLIVHLHWSDGDWKLTGDENGKLPKLGPGVGGSRGFILW